MRDGFIRTDNVLRGVAALAELKESSLMNWGGGISQRLMGVFEGLTGRGKTLFAEWYATQNQATVYLEAVPNWTPSWMLRDLAEALGLSREHALETNLRQVLEEQSRQPRLLLLDEANRLLRCRDLLEMVRYLHDRTKVPIVLVGEAGTWGSITRKSPRFADRCGQVVEFGDVQDRDIQAAARDLADLQLSPEVARAIRQRAEGNFRRAAKVVEELERVAKANPDQAGITLKMVDLAAGNLRLLSPRTWG